MLRLPRTRITSALLLALVVALMPGPRASSEAQHKENPAPVQPKVPAYVPPQKPQPPPPPAENQQKAAPANPPRPVPPPAQPIAPKPTWLNQAIQHFAPAPSLQLQLRVDPAAPLAGQSLRLTITPSQPVSQARYFIDWGDHTPAMQSDTPQASHVYTQAGSFGIVVHARALLHDKDVATTGELQLGVTTPPLPTPPAAPLPAAPLPADTVPAEAAPPQTIQPTLTLVAAPSPALPGTPVRFTVASNPPVSFAQFHYQFGDGAIEDGPNGLSHTYTQPRTYQATASTLPTDRVAALSSNSVQVVIRAAALPALRVALATPKPAAGKQTVVDARLAPAVSDATYRFNWGDGSASETVTGIGRAVHTYADSGAYTVSVTAFVKTARIPATLRITVASGPTSPLLPLAAAGALLLLGGAYTLSKYRPKKPTGELHTTCGVTRATQSTLSHSRGDYLSLTVRHGTGSPTQVLRFAGRPQSTTPGGKS